MSSPLRIVFAGTPEFALPSLRSAARHGEIVAVYTQPDRPAGRGRHLSASPVKQAALNQGWPVRQPTSLKTIQARQALAELKPDVMIVVAYGLILPPKILAIPRHGCWNVHASLLPRWRGAAPIQRAIEAGDAQTGVGLMQMAQGLDTGPVLLSLTTPIEADDTGGSLHNRLAGLGAEALSDGLTLLRAGMRPVAKPQSEAGATYARKLEKAEARLDWTQSAIALERKVRAFNPWPVAEAIVDGERLRIHEARARAQAHAATPGDVLATSRDGLDIACGEGVLRLTVVQREGGRALPIADYLNARQTQRS
jgi:methionyl-tRNA formyltransferase